LLAAHALATHDWACAVNACLISSNLLLLRVRAIVSVPRW